MSWIEYLLLKIKAASITWLIIVAMFSPLFLRQFTGIDDPQSFIAKPIVIVVSIALIVIISTVIIVPRVKNLDDFHTAYIMAPVYCVVAVMVCGAELLINALLT